MSGSTGGRPLTLLICARQERLTDAVPRRSQQAADCEPSQACHGVLRPHFRVLPLRKQDSEVPPPHPHPPLPTLFNQTHLQRKHKERHELTEAAHLPGYELC